MTVRVGSYQQYHGSSRVHVVAAFLQGKGGSHITITHCAVIEVVLVLGNEIERDLLVSQTVWNFCKI